MHICCIYPLWNLCLHTSTLTQILLYHGMLFSIAQFTYHKIRPYGNASHLIQNLITKAISEGGQLKFQFIRWVKIEGVN